jgi:hypothetical protein
MNTKSLYFMTRIALVAVFAMGLLLVPAFNSTGTVLAQRGVAKANKEVATPEMISYALNLRSATTVTVSAENGVTDKGKSSIRGRVMGTSRFSQDGETIQSRKDLAGSFFAINSLPCTDVGESDLSNKTFGPGVYCLSSARLAEELVLDADSDTHGIFIFRVSGTLNTEKGSIVSLRGNAQAANVYFAVDDSVTVGEGSSLKGNIIARNNITLGADATVEGRALSVKGEVALNNNILAPQAPGFIEICKVVDRSGGTGLANRVFRFNVPGGSPNSIVLVADGQCSGAIAVEAGTITITELLDGPLTTGGTFNGNFQLTNVRQVNNVGIPGTSVLVSANLPQFQATVNVIAPSLIPGEPSASDTRFEFTNRFAIIAVVEICKEGIDSGVFGTFNFTIDGLRQGTTNATAGGALGTAAPLVNIPVLTGRCSDRIAVVVPTSADGSQPRTGQITINELPRRGFIFTSATTSPGTFGGGIANTNRLVGFNVLGNGGGNATVTVVAGDDGGNGTNVDGPFGTSATAVQTQVFFNNRTEPGEVKVCKVAGPGIPLFTDFTFEVIGVVPFAPVVVDTPVPVNTNPVLTSGIPNTQDPSQGIARAIPAPGAVLQGGTVQRFVITVTAGIPTSPLQGSGCTVVPSTFVVDTAVFIRELTPTTVNITQGNGTATGITGEVRIARIISNTGILSPVLTATTTPNPAVGTVFMGTNQPGQIANPISGAGTVQPNIALFPPSDGVTRGVRVPVRRGTTLVEFVNIAFRPVPLKICKVAGPGVPVGTAFQFRIDADTAGGLLPAFTSTVTVNAGAAAVNPGDPNGSCDNVGGPFTPTLNGLGAFNFLSTITVTELAATGFVVSPISPALPAGGITSPTGGIITNIANRTALFSNLGINFNEVEFVNQAAQLATPAKKRRGTRIAF